MRRTVWIKNFGCQMNERDSEEVLGMLTAQGYTITAQPEEADVILLNTCSVREHAEERAMSQMGRLVELKQAKPQLVLGMIGCMAKLHQGAIFRRIPAVDLVAGPAELYDLPYLLAEIQERRQKSEVRSQRTEDRGQQSDIRGQKTADGGQKGLTSDIRSLTSDLRPLTSGRILAVSRTHRPLEKKPAGEFRQPGVNAFVTIMEGCDKACTYCIVPKTRGQEISRPAQEIIDEVSRLAEAGYRSITLLGQNVNSYGKRFPDGSGYKGPVGRLRLLEEDPDRLLDFPALLRLIDQSLHTAVRIRFTTSHPFDAHERLFEAMRDCPSICEWLHLPVQSGSNRMLRAMRRGYTAEAYLKKIEQVRRLIPEVSLSTDIIVGFPGETEEDYHATVRLMQAVGYDNAYLFKYSPRPGTDAAAHEDDVSSEAKAERLQHLLALQDTISMSRHDALVGTTAEILVEQRGTGERQWFGRTRGSHGVIMEASEDLQGHVLNVRIVRATPHTLFGERACTE